MSTVVSHRYDTSSRIGQPGSTLNRVVRLVGDNRRVIDFGSGPGVVASQLAHHGCDITVVDGDRDALRIASGHASRAYCLDLNDPSWPLQLETGDRYQVVVLADVLEHLADPAAVLASAAKLLTDDGYVVLSLPNVSHNGVIASLWQGSFNYSDTGILDRTHVHFFSAADLGPLLERASLILEHIEFVTTHPLHTEFADAWDSLPVRGKLALSSNRYGNVYQFVLRARPKSAGIEGVSLDRVRVPRLQNALWIDVRHALARIARRFHLIP